MFRQQKEGRAMNIGELLKDDDEEDDKTPAEKLYARAIYPYPLATGGPQLLPGRTRRCAFWISSIVSDGMAYVIDTTTLLHGNDGRRWIHNLAGDVIPDDCLLVVINSRYEDHIRKAIGSHDPMPGPAFVAARIIDSQCKEDKTLAARMNWRTAS